MSADTDITPDYHDLRVLKFLLVATNPRKALSMHAVAAALGCHPTVIQTLVDQGDIPTSVDGDATPLRPVAVALRLRRWLCDVYTGQDFTDVSDFHPVTFKSRFSPQ